MISTAVLTQLPKAELHCHMDGSVRPETLLELGREYGVTMPADDPEALRAAMLVHEHSTLEEYLQRFDVTLAVLQTADALERVAYELAADAAAEGVRYLEVRYAPVLNVRGGLSLGAAVDAPLRGLARAEREHDIVARVILCALRAMPVESSVETAHLAVGYKHRGVVGFDLAGGELGHPAEAHAVAFRVAREADLACTCHAGEGDGAQSVRQAVHACCAHRIGHGTRLIEDESLTRYVIDHRIAVEACLTSNVQTGAADSYDTHPARTYFDRGVQLVLNTDNRLMSGTTLVEEYAHAARHLGFSLAELGRVALNGFEHSFLPHEERTRLVARARDEIEALVGKSV
jgi:adenosine deaminase